MMDGLQYSLKCYVKLKPNKFNVIILMFNTITLNYRKYHLKYSSNRYNDSVKKKSINTPNKVTKQDQAKMDTNIQQRC